MYVPKYFIEEYKQVIQDIVDNFPLATLFMGTNENMTDNHIPFLLDIE